MKVKWHKDEGHGIRTFERKFHYQKEAEGYAQALMNRSKIENIVYLALLDDKERVVREWDISDRYDKYLDKTDRQGLRKHGGFRGVDIPERHKKEAQRVANRADCEVWLYNNGAVAVPNTDLSKEYNRQGLSVVGTFKPEKGDYKGTENIDKSKEAAQRLAESCGYPVNLYDNGTTAVDGSDYSAKKMKEGLQVVYRAIPKGYDGIKEDYDRETKDKLNKQHDENMPLRGKYLGRFINTWRSRTVAVYEHKNDPTKVITVGQPFDGSTPVVCIEDFDEGWKSTLSRIKDAESVGKVYNYR